MWHKLKDIFGSNEIQNTQTEIKDHQVEERSEQSSSKLSTDESEKNEQKESLSFTEPVNGVKGQTVSGSNGEQTTSLVTKIQEKVQEYEHLHHQCFECKVTASVMSLFIASVISRSLLKLKKDLHPRRHVFVYTANISLIGLWVSFMKKEWYDEKVKPK